MLLYFLHKALKLVFYEFKNIIWFYLVRAEVVQKVLPLFLFDCFLFFPSSDESPK